MLPLFSSLLFLLATQEAPSRAELSHGKKSLNSIDPLVSRALKETDEENTGRTFVQRCIIHVIPRRTMMERPCESIRETGAPNQLNAHFGGNNC